MCVSEPAPPCLWVCAHTHVSEVEVGRFRQIVFQFSHHLLPSLSTAPSSHHLHSWLSLPHPFLSPLPSSVSLRLK